MSWVCGSLGSVVVPLLDSLTKLPSSSQIYSNDSWGASSELILALLKLGLAAVITCLSVDNKSDFLKGARRERRNARGQET